MSEQTKAALDAAIAAHVADECEGDMVTAWVIVTETTSLEQLEQNRSTMFVDSRSMQSAYLTVGLLHAALHDEPEEED